jgi:acylphosphatase
MIRRVRVVISGQVQGVFFRATCRDRATALGVNGWVRNRADGSVEVLAEARAEALEAFLGWCRSGPPRSRVDACEVEDQPATGGLLGFEIR